MAFYDVTAFDIEFHDSYIVVRMYQVLLLLLVGEFRSTCDSRVSSSDACELAWVTAAPDPNKMRLP